MRLRNGAARPPSHEAEPLHLISAETAQLDNTERSHADILSDTPLAPEPVSVTMPRVSVQNTT
jgi:hypothetical protein